MKHILLNAHLRSKFGERVQRIPLDPGFNCPNRISGNNGCIFCDETGSAAPWIKKGMSITEQLVKGSQLMGGRYKAKKYIAYFQAFTTTNASPDKLERIYEEALSFPGVIGLAVSTRPDALPDDVIKVLEKYSRKTYLWVELGAQSMNDKSLEWMGRGHSSKVFTQAVRRLKDKDVEVIGHIIFGLPTETEQEMLDSFGQFIDTGIDGYKIHALHIIKNTPLARLYEAQPLKLIQMDEYIDLVRRAINMTPQKMVIHSLTGEVDEKRLVAPKWVLKKDEILRRIFE
ncbi:MAG: TIGR01212 family radical SAM protein [Proteobacteria bacterium]|nr:TIGR01212 family radical SAM protein [Pseudomonadota bacterium]